MIGLGGHRSEGGHQASGDINVIADGDINLASNANNAFTMIGLGGISNGANRGLVAQDINVVSNTGSVILDAGTGTNRFSMIGMGGFNYDGNKAANNINGTSANDIQLNSSSGSRAFTQIGLGGYQTGEDFHEHSSNITVQAGNDLRVMAGDGLETHSQIGNGGMRAEGSTFSGDIMATAGNEIELTGGLGDTAFAMLGHGGDSAVGAASGDVTVMAPGDITVTGTANSAQIGHGGSDSDVDAEGNIAVQSESSVMVQGGTSTLASAQIGHAGSNSTGAAAGDVNVQAGSLVFVSGGSTDGTYGQIGHGGYGASGNYSGGDEGVVMVTAGGDVSLQGGSGSNSYAQIGLGGGDATAGDADGSRDSKIVVQSTGGSVNLDSGFGAASSTQIGHGGFQDDGAMSGGVYVFADNGGLTLSAGTGTDAYSLIGHGAASGSSTGSRSGDVWTQASGAVTMNSSAVPATIGHITSAGPVSGNLAIIGDTVTTNAGAGIGIASMLNGGADAIIAATGGNLTFASDILYNGSGTLDLAASNNISIFSLIQNAGTGNINLIGGWDGSGLAPVNHNACPPVSGDFFNSAGLLASGNYGGNVTIGNGTQTQGAAVGSAHGTTRVAADNLNVLGSNGTVGGFAQLGYSTHGGSSTTTGDILATLHEDMILRGGTEMSTEALVGHGGGSGSLRGDISVYADSARVLGGGGRFSFAQVGHNSITRAEGDVLIDLSEDIRIQGGSNSLAYAKVGHGADMASAANYFGDISISAEDGVQQGSAQADKNDIHLIAGTGNNAYAQIGHGDFLMDSGLAASGTGHRKGNIQLRAGSDIINDGGMIGHVDPTESQGKSSDSNVVVAVSRDQPQSILGAQILGEPVPPNNGVGSIIAKNGASFAAPEGSQLRFYVPTREGVKVEEGTRINGASFTPVAFDDPRQLFETARVQIGEDGTLILRPFLPLFLEASQEDPYFNSAFVDSFVFFYDSLLATESSAFLDFLFQFGFSSNRDRVEDQEAAEESLPKSSNFRIGYRLEGEQPDPYSTWWLISMMEDQNAMLELAPDGTIYIWKLDTPPTEEEIEEDLTASVEE